MTKISAALNDRARLLGVSGSSGDLRDVRAAAVAGGARASLAIAMFVHSVRRAVGAMVGVPGGPDGLAFTGGIGEHDPDV